MGSVGFTLIAYEDHSSLHWLMKGEFRTWVSFPAICLPVAFLFVLGWQMEKLYSWHDVARRTEIVYNRALQCPNQDLLERLSRYAANIYIVICILLLDLTLKHLDGEISDSRRAKAICMRIGVLLPYLLQTRRCIHGTCPDELECVLLGTSRVVLGQGSSSVWL